MLPCLGLLELLGLLLRPLILILRDSHDSILPWHQAAGLPLIPPPLLLLPQLIREKGHWERRIVELGGPDYSKVGPKVRDSAGCCNHSLAAAFVEQCKLAGPAVGALRSSGRHWCCMGAL